MRLSINLSMYLHLASPFAIELAVKRARVCRRPGRNSRRWVPAYVFQHLGISQNILRIFETYWPVDCLPKKLAIPIASLWLRKLQHRSDGRMVGWLTEFSVKFKNLLGLIRPPYYGVHIMESIITCQIHQNKITKDLTWTFPPETDRWSAIQKKSPNKELDRSKGLLLKKNVLEDGLDSWNLGSY